MQAARAEQLIFSLLASIPFDGSEFQCHPGEVELKVRNWDKSSIFISSRLSLLVDNRSRERAADAIDRFVKLKDYRNRVIHDAVEVGIDMDGTTFALAVEYRREKGSGSSVYCHPVGAHQIADLACQFYELTKDIEAITHMIRHQSPCE